MCVCSFVQKFTFLWCPYNFNAEEFDEDDFNLEEAAAATLHSMAGRLTALVLQTTEPEFATALMTALRQAGPALSESLSSLKLQMTVVSPEHNFRIAAQAVRGLAPQLQHIELGLTIDPGWTGSPANVQAADAAFEELIRSLPSCPQLCLSGFDKLKCVSPQVEHWALLHHAPHLRCVVVDRGADLQEQVPLHATFGKVSRTSVRNPLWCMHDSGSQLISELSDARMHMCLLLCHLNCTKWVAMQCRFSVG